MLVIVNCFGFFGMSDDRAFLEGGGPPLPPVKDRLLLN